VSIDGESRVAETPLQCLHWAGIRGFFAREEAMVGSCARQAGDRGELHELVGCSRLPSRSQQISFVRGQLAGASNAEFIQVSERRHQNVQRSEPRVTRRLAR
jgi:hypothetical protein